MENGEKNIPRFTTRFIDPSRTDQARLWAPRTWWLHLVSDGTDNLFPPAARVEVPAETLLPSHRASFLAQPVILMGEAGSGVTSFFKHVEHVLSSYTGKPVPVVTLSLARREIDLGSSGEKDGFQSKVRESFRSWSETTPTVLRRVAPPGSPGEEIEILDGIQRLSHACAKEGFAAVVALANMAGYEKRGELLAGCRGLEESGRLSGARLLFLADEESQLDTSVWSEVLPTCKVYRTAYFSGEDLRTLWRPDTPQDPETAKIAEECLKWTGGHPLLAQTFFMRLAQEGLPLEMVGEDLVRRRPSTVSRWQRELRALIRQAAIEEKMEDYVKGRPTEEARVGPLDRPLFLAGWIRHHEDGPWRITSEAHVDWAREVFTQPDRAT